MSPPLFANLDKNGAPVVSHPLTPHAPGASRLAAGGHQGHIDIDDQQLEHCPACRSHRWVLADHSHRLPVMITLHCH
ncbi:MAG TPA: hypothetical protein VN327_13515 [Pseudonocardiaceae bacterium]|nr:hypothetical protein [Pseudonocardiaceae bacterium]